MCEAIAPDGPSDYVVTNTGWRNIEAMSAKRPNNTRSTAESQAILESIQDSFSTFVTLLDNNNRVLEIMGDMEEKAQGDYLFDINYIRQNLDEMNAEISVMLECMVTLGGDFYLKLRDRFDEINAVVKSVLPGNQPIIDDKFTRSFDELNRSRALSAGSKNAQLGEIKTTLGLPVPEGFAITASAYKYLIDANDLQARITRRIDSINIKSYAELEKVSTEIRRMISQCTVPDDLQKEMMASYAELKARADTDKFSMRSSAIGEDTLFSFAGQYASYLNVTADELINRYKEVLASKFTPKAIYYFMTHSLSEAELAMSVGVVSMINASASGVIYTCNPINPDDDSIHVNSIYGLGKYLVNGRLTPDTFRVDRKTGGIIEETIADKPVKLVVNDSGGTTEEQVPDDMRRQPSITREQLGELVEYAVKLDEHYHDPQDIEWAADQDGRLYLLQSRPLQVIRPTGETDDVDVSGYTALVTGGTTVCPGAGAGPIHHVTSYKDVRGVPDGAVLIAPNPFPGLITVMGRISALITIVGGLASHMATIAREYHIPTLVGIGRDDVLHDGLVVTVDATGRTIYTGEMPELVEARQPDLEHLDTSGIYRVLDRVLDLVSPLRLLHPADEDFKPENCVTFHDITRYAHQKAMEEMFLTAQRMDQHGAIGFELKTEIPLQIHALRLDTSIAASDKREVTVEELESPPLQAIWDGIRQEGWPSRPAASFQGSRMGTTLEEQDRRHFSESSFAILSKEYMILSLRMGYHFTTVEAMCTQETSKNYIQMQYKEGGASLERRIRRIKLLKEILGQIGFIQHRKGDFLSSIISYQDYHVMLEKLYLLGRLIMMTKQLDMALSSDAVAAWYTKDFVKKLGLELSRSSVDAGD